MEKTWDTYVRSHPEGSVFHLASWQRMICDSFSHKPMHVMAEDRGGNIIGILPLFLVRSHIFGRMLISTPQAAYGGILADSDSVAVQILERARFFAKENAVQFLELRCYRNSQNDSRLAQKDLYVTFRQELHQDPEKNMLAIPRKTRAEIREGIRNGLEFKVDSADVDAFYRVYSRSVHDLGTPVFSKRLFENGLKEFGPNCRIFSVHWKGKIVAAVWTLFYGNQVIPYYGGSIREFNRLAVNNFMYWMLIRYGGEHGYKIFDFGRSKKGTGSFDFKKRWGMSMEELPYQYHLETKKSMPDTSPLNPKFSLGIRLWRKLPLPVANALGPFISKHLI
jgi:FemAB-related protein (PEP-CTERM system-associated)